MSVLKFDNVSMRFGEGAQSTEVLKKINLEVSQGEFLVILGFSGTGKTTLIKFICKALGIEEEVSSPTFALVNEYQLPTGAPLFHFDLYRMEDPEEALDIGIEDYFDQPSLSFVEWPDRLGYLLPEAKRVIHIVDEGNQRKITFKG